MDLLRSEVKQLLRLRKKLMLIFGLLVVVWLTMGLNPQTVNASPLEAGYDCSSQIFISFDDCSLLVALYTDTGGATTWLDTTNWFNDTPCSWYGVMCVVPGPIYGISQITLGSNGLSGSVPAYLENLDELTRLELDNNDLVGPIPPELGNLEFLEFLFLEGNALTGNIPPELGNLANLQILNLSDNLLSGFVPSELGNAVGLVSLSLNNNPSLTGPLPLSFSNLASLSTFNFVLTDLCEPADAALQSWLSGVTSVTSTGVGCTDLCATQTSIPQVECEALVDFYFSTEGESWTNKTDWFSADPCNPTPWYGVACLSGHVHTLGFMSNNLAGTLPASIGDLPSLTQLWLPNNQIGGAIPAQLGSLTNVWQMSLVYNNFSGPIPTELGDMSAMQAMYLFGNELNWTDSTLFQWADCVGNPLFE